MLPGLEILWRVWEHPCATLFEECLDLAWTYLYALVVAALPFTILCQKIFLDMQN